MFAAAAFLTKPPTAARYRISPRCLANGIPVISGEGSADEDRGSTTLGEGDAAVNLRY